MTDSIVPEVDDATIQRIESDLSVLGLQAAEDRARFVADRSWFQPQQLPPGISFTYSNSSQPSSH